MDFLRKLYYRFHEFIKFGIVGCIAMSIHYGTYYLMMNFVSINIAFTIGYAVSLSFNFILSSFFTFKVKPTFPRFIKFCMSHAINYFIQIGLLNLFLALGLSAKLSPIPVYAISVPVNFFLVRFAMLSKKKQI